MNSKNKTTVSTKVSSSNKKSGMVPAGSENASAYFEKSGIRYGNKLNHTPFLVFKEESKNVEVEIVDNIKELLDYPSTTKVMSQWRGKNRSDYFQFTVGQLRKHIKANPPHVTQEV